ncbi:hypothetical protein F0562_027976 [Nyssa sinensis]|uniref:Uncharacterized protein n=1 Tax=Nyssa sinensis TaxID=561372 RepID=A0A5J5B742_9ASTE|nr:hypothetical protein F0562_027976 [Nyssa sinensis]
MPFRDRFGSSDEVCPRYRRRWWWPEGRMGDGASTDIDGGANHNEIDNNVSLGIVDQSSSCIPIPTGGSTGNAMTSITSTLSSGGGSGLSSNDHNNGKSASTTPNSSSGIVNCKGPNVGLNSNPQSITTSLLNNFPLPVSIPPGANFQQ